MFGRNLKLEDIVRGVKEAKPSMIRIGTHHYVRLSEKTPADFGLHQDDLESVEVIAPFGAAVPQSCETKILNLFKNVKVGIKIEKVISQPNYGIGL
jgi:hypothetical protein